MYSKSPIRHLLAAISTLALFAVVGCGDSGHKTCTDLCNSVFACAAKLNFSPADYLGADYQTKEACVSKCNSGTCPQKQQLIDCLTDMQCQDLQQVGASAALCSRMSGCTP